MSLTLGRAPLARPPGGQFNFPLAAPEHVLYFEDSPRRVRVLFNGCTVADSSRVKLLHETDRTPVYCFPESDVRREVLRPGQTNRTPHKGFETRWSVTVGDRIGIVDAAAWSYSELPDNAAFLARYFAFEWDSMDAWYEEDEQVFVHARDPYHRIDTRRSSRHVQIVIDGELVAETQRPVLLFETGLPTRYYIPRDDVRAELLESDLHTGCPYKGTASYHSVRTSRGLDRDVAWYYPDPLPEAAGIRNLLAFYNERVELRVDV